jgi:hypothetical protein
VTLALRPPIDVQLESLLARLMSVSRLPKMMIGFVVRRCTIELGHQPSAAEFAAWANAGADREAHVFGRPISEREAGLILRHQARLVSARSAAPEERWADVDEVTLDASNVVNLAAARARRTAGRTR